ncbi:hypothetical protein CEUSTIGMA_g13155.t1 [Chlamydomonas eustigma]|uniref:cyclin-dependent kinase n=1 Tax=Chlamydomonas eustigma TaxID=1157962 RepID=A0A250XSG4_9CHLO|nr:hypothetical protein CEUSTIGMA_g13155.t1 [Chlamydomonas eustigma]|eukprot:GAX85740.1 hypothetical protein CEUSTIGMA_g13155.t1 [Chlamydomonas eustigma]
MGTWCHLSQKSLTNKSGLLGEEPLEKLVINHDSFSTQATLMCLTHMQVILCRIVHTGEVVAVKKIHLRNAEKPGMPDNVLREFKSLQTLDHPNIVKLLDVFPKGSSVLLVQEFCCTDLARVIRSAYERFPEAMIKGILQQILRGLRACHSSGIMHRDIKPSNILISNTGWVKLGDFGLARPLSNSERPLYTHTVATRWYRAPELLYGAREYTEAVDIWALGMVFAELIGLSPLVPGENDIDQIGKMTQVLGDIETAWPGVAAMPDHGKITFPICEGKPLGALLPGASKLALKLLAQMIRYDPERRISVDAALQDTFFLSEPLPCAPGDLKALINIS